MTPYYAHGGIEIYHGDCREVLYALPRLDGCVLLTDPPYGIDGGSGGDARDFGKGNYAGNWPDTREWIRDVCAPIIDSLVSVTIRGAVTPGIRNLDLYPRPADMGCFWTPAAATHGPWGFTTFQPILYYGSDYRAGKGALPSGKQVTERAVKRGHPCPKPDDAWAWLLAKVALPGETIIDPFLSSGTTAVVAKRSGHSVIGIEIEERYCEIAAKRLQQEALPLEASA